MFSHSYFCPGLLVENPEYIRLKIGKFGKSNVFKLGDSILREVWHSDSVGLVCATKRSIESKAMILLILINYLLLRLSILIVFVQTQRIGYHQDN